MMIEQLIPEGWKFCSLKSVSGRWIASLRADGSCPVIITGHGETSSEALTDALTQTANQFSQHAVHSALLAIGEAAGRVDGDLVNRLRDAADLIEMMVE